MAVHPFTSFQADLYLFDRTEIDQNFSQAHRIVTTSILPLVEQYAEHSRDVWEGAKVG
jgi:DASH complex subunit ASK1